MAKKKSKTQKYKKNIKDKQKKQQKKIIEETQAMQKISESGATKATLAKQSPKVKAKKSTTSKTTKPTIVEKEKINYNFVINNKKDDKKNKTAKTTTKPDKKIVKKDDVIYNLPLTQEKAKPKKSTSPIKKESIKSIWLAFITTISLICKKFIGNIKAYFKKKKTKKIEKQAIREFETQVNEPEPIDIENEELSKEEIKELKRKEKQKEIRKKNIFIRLIYDLVSNRHILFNAVLIMFFIVLLIGLIRIEVVSKGTILYVTLIAIFLMSVAISYNRYLSGKIYTILLCCIMGFAIYRMQYTYDFIRNMNSAIYEYKTYYVVTFNNSQNKSIFNINNKKTGLLNENTINIERKLNTKLDKVNYIEYDNLNDLFSDFYDQHFRAVLVNENQYKYLKNHIDENARDVKILYEFKANAKK